MLTKLDGDARGGAALSVVSVVGVPIAFVGSGEQLTDLELFHPDRIVSRMLGMGDVLSLIEKAEQAIDQDEAADLEEKLRKNDFTLDDFRKQLKTIRRMGPLESILGMIPGLGDLKQLADNKPDEKQMGRVEAIIGSMTPEERRNDRIINGSRRKRIAKGSGTTVEEVNRLLKQFTEMRKVLAMMSQGGMPGMKGMAEAAADAEGDRGAWRQEAEKGRALGLIKTKVAGSEGPGLLHGRSGRSFRARRMENKCYRFVYGGWVPRRNLVSASWSWKRVRRVTAASSRTWARIIHGRSRRGST